MSLEVPGTIEIALLESTQRLRLRWLIEDIDTFAYHSVAAGEGDSDSDDDPRDFELYGTETYFASLMVDDFFHPVEIGIA
jgi:hypothetical protein